MTGTFTPERWAFEITHLLNTVLGADRFPIDIPMVAKEYTAQRFPDDPIITVAGDDLPNFDGALFRAPAGRKGWGIIYNNAISRRGGSILPLRTSSAISFCTASPIPTGFAAGSRMWFGGIPPMARSSIRRTYSPPIF
jgi:hypothetical protein